MGAADINKPQRMSRTFIASSPPSFRRAPCAECRLCKRRTTDEIDA
jgi:hypothetical protein